MNLMMVLGMLVCMSVNEFMYIQSQVPCLCQVLVIVCAGG